MSKIYAKDIDNRLRCKYLAVDSDAPSGLGGVGWGMVGL